MIFLSTQNKPSVGSSPQKTDTAHAVILERGCYTGRMKNGSLWNHGVTFKIPNLPFFFSLPSFWPYIVLEINLVLLYFLKCLWPEDKALYSRDREFTAWLVDALCHFFNPQFNKSLDLLCFEEKKNLTGSAHQKSRWWQNNSFHWKVVRWTGVVWKSEH